MLGQSNLDFERRYFVKDLYRAKYFLNNFKIVEFENIRAFYKVKAGNYHKIDGEIFIHIYDKPQFESVKQIIIESELAENCKLFLILHDNKLLRMFDGLDKKKFDIVVNKDFKVKDFIDQKPFMEYRRDNPMWMTYEIRYDNIDTVFDEIIDQFQEENTRFFFLDFDYESFEKAKIGELHRIYFRVSRFLAWVISSKEEKVSSHPLVYYSGNIKRIFVDDQLQLWFNNKHFKERAVPHLFTLVEGTGETISLFELNNLRQYMDITRDSLIMETTSWLGFIDFYQNIKIQGVVNEVPYITELINRWLRLGR